MPDYLQRNIISLYIIKISHWFMLTMPIVVLFYFQNHLTLQDVFILQAVYSIACVVLEIPTGYLADVWGRKNTIVIGTTFGLVGYFIYTLSSGFWGFLLAELTLGIGQSFISGSDSALLYDTLYEKGKQDKYLRYEGRMTSFGNFAEATAGILGGLLAIYSLRTPFMVQMGVALIAIPAAFLLVEPAISIAARKPSLKEILQVVRNSLFVNKPLRRNIFYSSAIGASTLTMAWFIQPYFKLIDIPISWYGILWTALNFTVGIAALGAYKVERWMGQKYIIIMVTTFVLIGYIGMAWFSSVWGLLFAFAFYIIRGIATPVLKDYINKLTASEVRATVLSVRNFIIRLLFSSVGPFVGWISDMYSLTTALYLTGTIYFVIGSFFGVLYISTRKLVTRK